MRRAYLLFVLYACASSPAPLGGQPAAELAAGDRVRVWVPSNALVAEPATVDSVAPALLVLRVPRLAFPLTVPLDSIARLDVRTSGGSALGGAFVGGAAGFALGLAISRWGIGGSACARDGPCEVAYLAFPPGGLVVGALLGGLLARSPWKRVPLSR